jgi:hypothetical protein
MKKQLLLPKLRFWKQIFKISSTFKDKNHPKPEFGMEELLIIDVLTQPRMIKPSQTGVWDGDFICMIFIT